ncbi:glycyl-radical enzyme activating protein [Parabacteroides sp. OttesenSCG-928-O15]|nr:glycyl-radical enzyme activating protein [Parabacteroides sp. OttesenSCG-928-O15]
MTATIFDIKRYAINDGPGIRITLFFKGCPLSCLWCHNPEGISPRKEKLYTRKKCLGCRVCVEKCPENALTFTSEGILTDPAKCNVCGICADHCPSLAMQLSGEEYTIDRLMQEIEKETLVMDRSEGGVTFSGGEPFMQPKALLELLKRCGKRGIHRTIDTTLYVKPDILQKAIPETDLFLVDLKQMDSSKHQYFCGTANERILQNIRLLASSEAKYIIRIPLIEGVNADRENIEESAAFLATLDHLPQYVDLLSYHDIGRSKHDKRGSTYNPTNIKMQAPSDEKLAHCRELFEKHGIAVHIGG